jgi:hypothetical protein
MVNRRLGLRRRYKRRTRAASPIQEKKGLKKDQDGSHQVSDGTRPNLQRVIDGRSNIRPESLLHLQGLVGNKIARQLISNGKQKKATNGIEGPTQPRSQSGDIVQREPTKLGHIGPRTKKPPAPPGKKASRPTEKQPWQHFQRPQPPGRFRRRAKPEEGKEKKQQVAQEAQSLAQVKSGDSGVISAAAFEKQTTLTIFGKKSFLGIKRKQKSREFFDGVTAKLREYEGPIQSKGMAGKVHFLKMLVEDVASWLRQRGKKSSRSKFVESLIVQVTTEVDRLHIEELEKGLKEYEGLNSQEHRQKAQFLQNLLFRVKGRTTIDAKIYPYYDQHYFKSKLKLKAELLERRIDDEIDNQLWEASETKDWFTSQSASWVKENFAGGELNKLDWMQYDLELRKAGKKFQKVTENLEDLDLFSGFFKKKSHYDPLRPKHRGYKTNMPTMQPGHHRRTVAMFKLDQLLGTDVIPPTFLAKHKGKMGTVMEEVEGKTGKEAKDDQYKDPVARQALSDPITRQALSKLYLLDVIAGQVDRHSGNYVIEMQGGVVKGVKGIDLDLAFGEGYTGATVEKWNKQIQEGLPGKRSDEIGGQMPAELDVNEIDHKLARKIGQLAGPEKNKVREALMGYMSETEIEATMSRLKSLAEFLKPIIDKEDGQVISKV